MKVEVILLGKEPQKLRFWLKAKGTWNGHWKKLIVNDDSTIIPINQLVLLPVTKTRAVVAMHIFFLACYVQRQGLVVVNFTVWPLGYRIYPGRNGDENRRGTDIMQR